MFSVSTPPSICCCVYVDVDSTMICAVAGMTSDANILINTARTFAQQYLYTYDDNIPCEQLVKRLCDLKQGYTQTGGRSPLRR